MALAFARHISPETPHLLAAVLSGRRRPRHLRSLIILARQTLERVLTLDDAGAAVFVLEEEAHGRDPAVTLADGVRAAQARTRRPSAPRPPVPAGRRHSGLGYAPGYDPLRALMQRGSARLRTEVRVEDALRRAAVAAAPTSPPTPELSANGVVAIRAATANGFRPAQADSPPAALDPVEAQPHAGVHGPRQPRTP